MYSTAFLDLPPLQAAAGEVHLPGSKSISNRVLLLAALSHGTTAVHDLLASDDTRVMLDALRAKFTQHDDLKAVLLGTGDAVLIEHTANDSYWADGGDGSGKNRLGLLLMRLREELREEMTGG